jgi:uncharacterized protein YjbJ (UPF0337 family)
VRPLDRLKPATRYCVLSQCESLKPIRFGKKGKCVMSGTSDKIKGRVKEAVGALTGNRRLKRQGKVDQVTGKIKRLVERVIDKSKKR